MAHKKGVGSSRNGRDSRGQRRGIKRHDGQIVKAGNIDKELSHLLDKGLGDEEIAWVDATRIVAEGGKLHRCLKSFPLPTGRSQKIVQINHSKARRRRRTTRRRTFSRNARFV